MRQKNKKEIKRLDNKLFENKQLFIHVGLPKTGTTVLQNRIFPNHDEYLYMGKFNKDIYSNASIKNRWLSEFNKILIRKDLPYIKNLDFGKMICDRFSGSIGNHSKLFLSEENILSRCLTPGKYGGQIRIGSAYYTFSKLKNILEQNLFDSVKLILVLRRQDDLIESFFAEEYHNFKKYFGLKSIDQFVELITDYGQMEEIDSLLHYNTFIEYLYGLFGQTNVLALPYEKLNSHPEKFLMTVSNFMGIQTWANISVLKEKRDNSRSVKKSGGKIANDRPLRNTLASFKKMFIGDLSTGLGKHLEFVNRFQRQKVIKLSTSQREKLKKHYKTENEKLMRKVKYISECNYI